MSTNQIVERLKENGEDFEWYPTTQEIVNCLAKKIFTKRSYGQGEYECKYHSVLDIGCGNGSFFEKIDRTEEQKFNETSDYGKMLRTRYGIEKSFELCERLPGDVVIIGSDFHEQTLIDKKVDLIFCNPPYSEFELWTKQIIMQGNCKAIALVIPCRWRMHPEITYALKKRGMKAESLGTFDFLNADRRARAKVDLLFITADDVEFDGRRYRKEANDPFDVWFDETFKISAEKEKGHEWERNEAKRQELVAHGDTAEMLVQFYNSDMEKLYSNYRQLETLDADIFKELKVDVKNLKNIRLDYRIVVQAWSNFRDSWSREGMSDDCYDFLEDTYIIAENLGFSVGRILPKDKHEICVEDWRNFDVHLADGTLFANIKLYKNGNRHVKFCKEFMQKLNVEMARINGWVQDKSEAATEMGMSAAEIERFWGSNRKIEITAGKQLLGLPA